MPCYSPLKGWLSNEVNGSGKRSIVFNKSEALFSAPVSIPCGQCIGCRLEKSRQWAIRCVHEASLYEDNCFITLTFEDRFVPANGSLVKSDFQKFMKRLRKMFGKGVRYYHCGEYGSKLERPHHHACLFNFDFPDKKLWTVKGGNRLYSSEILSKLWPFGFCLIGDVTFESAAYVARYMLKKFVKNKVYPGLKEEYYHGRLPEYTTMSRRPGIGYEWFKKFSKDVFPEGYITIRGGIKCRVPVYYESIFDLTNPDILDKIKLMRSYGAFNDPNNSPDRLRVREDLQIVRAKLLKREVENAV